MAKQNSIPRRIDGDLDELIREIELKNDMTKRQASKEIAKIVKEFKIQGKKIEREIKF